MRDPNRLYNFYNQLTAIHITNFPDWRFGQLMINFMGWVCQTKKTDVFYFEENALIRLLEEYVDSCKFQPLSTTKIVVNKEEIAFGLIEEELAEFPYPVKANYEFMMQQSTRQFVASILVRTVVQDKVVLTTREILNFIYDILVSNNITMKDIDIIGIIKTAMSSEAIGKIIENCTILDLKNPKVKKSVIDKL